MRNGGIGVIEEGNLKGRRFIIPAEVLVEKGRIGDSTEYSKACLIHQRFIPHMGCPDCAEEVQEKQEQARTIGL